MVDFRSISAYDGTMTSNITSIPARIVLAPLAGGAVDILRTEPGYESGSHYAKIIPIPCPRYVSFDGVTITRMGKPLLHRGKAHRGSRNEIY